MGQSIYTKAEREANEKRETQKATENGHAVKKHRNNLQAHDLAGKFPLMRGADLDALAADIRSGGQRDPIVLLGGLVLDGRNRLQACKLAEVEPKIREFGSWPGDGDDPRAFVISENIQRRHLNETQRAAVANRLATKQLGDNQHGSANLQTLSMAEACAVTGVSERSGHYARKAEEAGLGPLLDEGEIAVSKAAKLADRPDFPVIMERVMERGELNFKNVSEVLGELRDGADPVVETTSGRGKPDWLMRALVRHYSRYGQTVCDPLAGYGSTLRAARAESRKAIGSELVEVVAAAANDSDIRVGRWQDALADIETVDAVICDPPYGERTHNSKPGRSDGSSAKGLAPTYDAWTPADVDEFVDSWAPRCRGWMVALTDSDLAPAWRAAYDRVGLKSFAPVPCVIKGMSVRLSGDGPSSWTVYAMVARTKEVVAWDTLPGAYVGTKTRELWNADSEETDIDSEDEEGDDE